MIATVIFRMFVSRCLDFMLMILFIYDAICAYKEGETLFDLYLRTPQHCCRMLAVS